MDDAPSGKYGWSIHKIRQQGREESRRWTHRFAFTLAGPADLLAGVTVDVYDRLDELAWFRTHAEAVEKDDLATGREREIVALWREAVAALERYIVEKFADLKAGRDASYKATAKRRREGNPALESALAAYQEAVDVWRFAVWEEHGPEMAAIVARLRSDRMSGPQASRARIAWERTREHMMEGHKRCPECGKYFAPKRASQIYDTHTCADRAGARRRRSAANRGSLYNPPDED